MCFKTPGKLYTQICPLKMKEKSNSSLFVSLSLICQSYQRKRIVGEEKNEVPAGSVTGQRRWSFRREREDEVRCCIMSLWWVFRNKEEYPVFIGGEKRVLLLDSNVPFHLVES